MRASPIWLLLLASEAALGQKISASLDCKYAGKELVYDCVIRLNPPAQGVQITVGADMPSMPMAHNIGPVKARPTQTPGEYRATLELEMTGEWAVKLRLAGARRDQLVLHYEFDERGARAVTRTGKPARR